MFSSWIANFTVRVYCGRNHYLWMKVPQRPPGDTAEAGVGGVDQAEFNRTKRVILNDLSPVRPLLAFYKFF